MAADLRNALGAGDQADDKRPGRLFEFGGGG